MESDYMVYRVEKELRWTTYMGLAGSSLSVGETSRHAPFKYVLNHGFRCYPVSGGGSGSSDGNQGDSGGGWNDADGGVSGVGVGV